MAGPPSLNALFEQLDPGVTLDGRSARSSQARATLWLRSHSATPCSTVVHLVWYYAGHRAQPNAWPSPWATGDLRALLNSRFLATHLPERATARELPASLPAVPRPPLGRPCAS